MDQAAKGKRVERSPKLLSANARPTRWVQCQPTGLLVRTLQIATIWTEQAQTFPEGTIRARAVPSREDQPAKVPAFPEGTTSSKERDVPTREGPSRR